MSKRLIKAVDDNMSKHFTYKELNKRKIDAYNNGNYMESIQYSYAMIEDRLLSILHHIYIINRKEYPYKFEEKVGAEMTNILYPNKNKKIAQPRFDNINTKITTIQKIYNYKGEDIIIKKIQKHLLLNLNIEEFKKDINKLKKWKNFRNEFTHAIYNKDMNDIISKEKEQALIGIELSESFDRYTELLKGYVNNTNSLRYEFENKQ